MAIIVGGKKVIPQIALPATPLPLQQPNQTVLMQTLVQPNAAPVQPAPQPAMIPQQLKLGATKAKPDLAAMQMANVKTNATAPPDNELVNAASLAKYQSPAAEALDPNLASAYQEKMNYLAELLQETDDKNSITDAVENCLLYIQNNVQLKPLITAENVQLIVRAARKGAAGIIAKKRVTKAKKTARVSKVNEFDDMLGDIGF